MNNEQENKMLVGLSLCGLLSNDIARTKGFWETPDLYEKLTAEMASGNYTEADFKLLEQKFSRNFGEALMLVVSELAEALEVHRNSGIDKPAEHIDPEQFTHLEEELADVVIRVLDLGYGLNLSVAAAVVAKMKYNETRPPKHNKSY